MKKSLIALAAVAASGFAMAQSSVTLFGVLDASVTHVNGANNWTGMEPSANSSSRLGFRGVEDLGGGLKAQFWLEGAVRPDDGGTAGAGGGTGGFEFKRRSTVSLMGNFGEVRLGRSTTAAYDAYSRYDNFGTVGIGASQHWSAANEVRTSNMLSYYSPSFSGFKVGVNYGFGEVAGSTRANRYMGIGATYDNGPISVGAGYDRLNDASALGDRTTWALGGSYNFNVVKLAAAYNHQEHKLAGAKLKDKGYLVALTAPVGAAGEAKVSYNRYDLNVGVGGKAKADQLALGYVHSLSKRTAVYGTYAYIKNKNGGQWAVSGRTDLKSNGKQQAIQVGVRHSF